ncbi:hypothetical protein C5167_013283 [Papaver somniferum]|uniref:Uncharacterized protein n=1 Tax=Papaver somniferum TaxID=3469 RepID=A0A4Y7J2Y3_PAPSO|nr:uncharacterized protein LOC113356428 [Papaver somniferum]XP_026455341.1 uncharacterized protein LOC113356428 [Papaver somniferum]RZC54430.1 hypothetical protein C5167_013283 [Papaver somniferum]
MMGFGALRNIIRPFARTVLNRSVERFPLGIASASSTSSTPELRSVFSWFLNQSCQSWMINRSNEFHSLTDTRLPKRRPGFTNRRKRSGLKPPGPYAWVQYTPGEPLLPNTPNEGSVKRRNEKKRIGQRKAFIKSEAKKRKVQVQEAKRKKIEKRVERKMAAVARDRAWAVRLAELQQLEAAKATKS